MFEDKFGLFSSTRFILKTAYPHYIPHFQTS